MVFVQHALSLLNLRLLRTFNFPKVFFACNVSKDQTCLNEHMYALKSNIIEFLVKCLNVNKSVKLFMFELIKRFRLFTKS